jgi:hypothetical protein
MTANIEATRETRSPNHWTAMALVIGIIGFMLNSIRMKISRFSWYRQS